VSGVWEVLGFTDATEFAAGRFRLTGLLRGLGGTEDAVVAGAAAGADVVLLDAAVKPLPLATAERGATQNWILEPMGLVTEISGPHGFAGGLRAETPLSPVHLKAARSGAGDVALSWIRRGRTDSDSWSEGDIPLDEELERYRVEILDGAIVRRSVEVMVPQLTYAAGDEIADFGATQASLKLRIRQLGRLAAGLPLEAIIPIR
jgi:hypothetical protein